MILMQEMKLFFILLIACIYLTKQIRCFKFKLPTVHKVILDEEKSQDRHCTLKQQIVTAGKCLLLLLSSVKREREKNISLFIQAASNLNPAAVSLSLPPVRVTSRHRRIFFPFKSHIWAPWQELCADRQKLSKDVMYLS